MKKNKYIHLCACLLLWGTAASAESLGSSDKDIQKNFNRLVATKQCPGCDLRGSVLTRMDLREADLQGADLSGAKLGLTNLSKANLKNAVLRGATLGGADFAGADLRGVDLTDAQLAGAYLKEALLDQELTLEKPYEPEELPEVVPKEVKGKVPEESPEIEEIELPETSSLPSVQERINPEPESDTVAFAAEEEEILPSTVSSTDSGEEEALRPAETPTGTAGGTEESSAAVLAPSEPSALPVQPVKPVQESREKKKQAVSLPELPDIEGRTATTVRPKELVPIAEAQIVTPDQADSLPDALPGSAESKSAGLDDIPVIDTASEQEKGEAEETELSVWDTFTSLFGSDAAEKEKIEKAAVTSGPVEKKGPDLKASEIKVVAQEEKAAQSPVQQQVGAYTVETFGQSLARVQTLVDKLHEEKRCVSCDLAGADLVGEDLEEVDLERANLSGAQLEKADLRAANLKGVNFTDANLKNADLRGADLYLADFTDADLTGAQLEGALIDSTTFTGAIGAKVEAAHE